MSESLLITGFTVVFTGIPEGLQRAQAVGEFLKGFASVAPSGLTWPSGAPVEAPRTSPGAPKFCEGISYDPMDKKDKLSWGCYSAGPAHIGFGECMQALGLTYNNN